MKTIGMIGGMSWESSIEYYRIINEATREELGGLHSAKSIMYSVEFAEIEALQHAGRWQEAARILIKAARSLEKGSADFVLICTNTMHKLYEDVQREIQIPMLHIADATAEVIKAKGIGRIGLLGTRFTMEEDFYRGRLIEKYDLQVMIPTVDEMQEVHRIIYDELCAGKIIASSTFHTKNFYPVKSFFKLFLSIRNYDIGYWITLKNELYLQPQATIVIWTTTGVALPACGLHLQM